MLHNRSNIMHSLKVRRLLAAAFITAQAMPLLVNAQQPGDAPPPPRTQKLEEGESPAVTIRKPDQERKITEKRARGGKVTEVKVTNGKSTYYLKPNDPPGAGLPGDTQSDASRSAQWEVQQFDLGRKQIKEAQAQEAASVPAPPTAPAKK
jgi:hypothetical protein